MASNTLNALQGVRRVIGHPVSIDHSGAGHPNLPHEASHHSSGSSPIFYQAMPDLFIVVILLLQTPNNFAGIAW